MRHFLLLGFFLLATLLGRAQAPAPATPLPLVGSESAAPDTVAALHNFYKHKRRALPRMLLATGGLFAVTLFAHEVFSSTPTYGQTQKLGDTLAPLVTGALGVTVLGAEALYYTRYSKRQERHAIEDFQAHQLRRSVREQLKPKYFQPVPLAR
ncbi:hypothetical protein [Hymenobacter bucti]|uniref:DUF4231 domain-containing protein n=1 Tax=Hymenobacter bucti TaxID=1844114 RepID=A0ABW4QWV4_9BACT